MEECYSPPRAPPSFVLVPVNKEAHKVIAHPRNAAYQENLENNTFGLRIDFSKAETQEFKLGWKDTNIYLPESRSSKAGPSSDISPLQASFILVADTGAVLLCDYSKHHNTVPFSPKVGYTVPFNEERSGRAVLVARGINCRVAFGRDKWYEFEICWDSDGLYNLPNDYEPYSLGPKRGKIKKYMVGAKLGAGTYGTVFSALDLYNGQWVALKRFHNISGKNLDFATREVKNLYKINQDMSISHEHVLEILDFAGGGKNDDWCEIMMPLKLGNLKRLVEEERQNLNVVDLAARVLRQMLLALKCTAEHKIIHRDIKPENILWEYDKDGNYHFCLGDFGLSNDRSIARTTAGTEPFMAPEILNRKEQTEKVDMWSLFATIVWVHNTENFRQYCPNYSVAQIHSWLLRIAKRDEYATTRAMASYDPKKRPSAKRMLRVLNKEEPPPDLDPVEDLAEPLAHLSMGASGNGDAERDQDEMEYLESLGMRYYEPYSPWGTEGQSSDAYQPPPVGGSPRDPNWVIPIEPPYATIDNRTRVPHQWPTRTLELSDDDNATDPNAPLPQYSGSEHPFLAKGGPSQRLPAVPTSCTSENDSAVTVRAVSRRGGKGKGKARK